MTSLKDKIRFHAYVLEFRIKSYIHYKKTGWLTAIDPSWEKTLDWPLKDKYRLSIPFQPWCTKWPYKPHFTLTDVQTHQSISLQFVGANIEPIENPNGHIIMTTEFYEEMMDNFDHDAICKERGSIQYYVNYWNLMKYEWNRSMYGIDDIYEYSITESYDKKFKHKRYYVPYRTPVDIALLIQE